MGREDALKLCTVGRGAGSSPGFISAAQRITEIPTKLKAEMKKEAERKAWALAQQRVGLVKCPCCQPKNRVSWAVFAGG